MRGATRRGRGSCTREFRSAEPTKPFSFGEKGPGEAGSGGARGVSVAFGAVGCAWVEVRKASGSKYSLSDASVSRSECLLRDRTRGSGPDLEGRLGPLQSTESRGQPHNRGGGRARCRSRRLARDRRAKTFAKRGVADRPLLGRGGHAWARRLGSIGRCRAEGRACAHDFALAAVMGGYGGLARLLSPCMVLGSVFLIASLIDRF